MKFNARYANADWHQNLKLQRNYFNVIGLGGIGSHLAFKLSRIGVRHLNLYDDDMVESHNVGGQLFSYQQVEEYKVNAIKDYIDMMKGEDQTLFVYDFNKRIEKLPDLHYYYNAINFVCVDNMDSRIKLANSAKESWNKGCEFMYFESRLGPTGYEIYYVTKENVDFYIKNCLFTDEEANAVTCSYQQTTHVASALSSRIVNILTNQLNNEILNQQNETGDLKYFPVPFYIRENCDLLTIKVVKDVDTWE